MTNSAWTFEIEGEGVPGGYYSPAEEWDRAGSAATWLACALWDFGAIDGDRDITTDQAARRLTPVIGRVTSTASWGEGAATVTVIRLHPPFPSMPGAMEQRRKARRRQRRRAVELTGQ